VTPATTPFALPEHTDDCSKRKLDGDAGGLRSRFEGWSGDHHSGNWARRYRLSDPRRQGVRSLHLTNAANGLRRRLIGLLDDGDFVQR
jgi:hypothetical protein